MVLSAVASVKPKQERLWGARLAAMQLTGPQKFNLRVTPVHHPFWGIPIYGNPHLWNGLNVRNFSRPWPPTVSFLQQNDLLLLISSQPHPAKQGMRKAFSRTDGFHASKNGNLFFFAELKLNPICAPAGSEWCLGWQIAAKPIQFPCDIKESCTNTVQRQHCPPLFPSYPHRKIIPLHLRNLGVS